MSGPAPITARLLLDVAPAGAAAPARAGGGFAATLDAALTRVERDQVRLDAVVADVGAGKPVHAHDVSLAAAQADLSLRLALEVRNKVVEGLQDVLRTQV